MSKPTGSGAEPGASANRAVRIAFTSWPTRRFRSPRPGREPSDGLGRLGDDGPSVRGRRRRRRADPRGAAADPRRPARPRCPAGPPASLEIARRSPSAARTSSRRGSAMAAAGRPGRSPSATSITGRSCERGGATAAHGIEVEAELEAVAARGPGEAAPAAASRAPAAAPTCHRPRRSRAAASSGASPCSGGRRSMSVRNSYSRKSLMTSSRS